MVYCKPEDIFPEAFNFVFKEVYPLWKADLEKIFSIGTKKDQLNKGGCNLATVILVIIGIESIARFFYYSSSSQTSISRFVNTYFPEFYRGKFTIIYKLYRNGLAHYAYPKMQRHGKQSQCAIILHSESRTGPKYVAELEKIKEGGPLGILRRKQEIDKKDTTFKIFPQVLFLDAIEAIEKFKDDLLKEESMELRRDFVENYIKVRREIFKI